MKSLPLLLAPAVAWLLAGCIVIPISGEDPYPPERLAQLGTHGADKERARQLFGQPTAIRSGGKFWFYATVRERAGILGQSAAAVVEDYEWLAVQFDDSGRVVFYEFNDDNQGCLSNGICHLKGLFAELESKTVLTAPAEFDGQAKQRKVKPDECAIYFYQQPKIHLRAGNYPVDVYVDGRLFGTTSFETYLFIAHPVGEVELGAYQFEKALKCDSGETYYIEAIEGWFVKAGEALDVVPADIGVPAINKRRLALPE